MQSETALLSPQRAAELERLLGKHERKAKTSISLSAELLRAADLIAGTAQRSALIERALRHHLKSLLRRSRQQRDLAAIAAQAMVTNRESDELLALQAWPE
jgi:metal-responsive CopG/Arc/MetJ family transcriptional regulator